MTDKETKKPKFEEPTNADEVNYLVEQARRIFSYERRMKLFSAGATNAEVVRIMNEEI